ncbi:MAG: hypothetical protein ACRC5T_03265 [Cetobacterium sp.]
MTETQNEINLRLAQEEYEKAKDKVQAAYKKVQKDVTKLWEARKGWIPQSLEDVSELMHAAYDNTAASEVEEAWINIIDPHLKASGFCQINNSNIWLPGVQVTLAKDEHVPDLADKMLGLVGLFGQETYAFSVMEHTLSRYGVVQIAVRKSDGLAQRTKLTYGRLDDSAGWKPLEDVLVDIAKSDYYPAVGGEDDDEDEDY